MGKLLLYVYLMGVVGTLKAVLFCFFILFLALIIISLVVILCSDDEDDGWIMEYNTAKHKIKKFGWVCLILLGAIIFIPGKATMAVLVGSEIANIAVETPEFEKIRAVINIKLNEIIEE